ncbi:NADPH-dependent ferric siderophore reductase [Humitalea rosea]|uniref:NADPH-dependent ferric siderophore reductase n=1 Tax=Humitalea rosea TaxID=990373 RepID=A0A2W7IGG9_9PROT|nr:siderophore-interacting protein [Humitalea rosea]PZW37873.1 NADPH-dependent ferric siderophore reductase [Humitalea rosea]
MSPHAITRVRRETRRRWLTVASVERLTPRMLRIGFVSPELGDFTSASPDDHIKLFFPAGAEKPPMRDFTPRAFDPAGGTLVVDFALHEAGPAMQWAMAAEIGQRLEIGGPRGSMIVPDDFDWYLLIGDETALPAIGRRVEELRPGVPVTTAVVIADAGERQVFAAKADWTPLWATRDSASGDDAALLIAALAAHPLPPGDGFVWIAAEATVARALRSHLIEERQHPAQWLKASGYWKRGQADVHERIGD